MLLRGFCYFKIKPSFSQCPNYYLREYNVIIIDENPIQVEINHNYILKLAVNKIGDVHGTVKMSSADHKKLLQDIFLSYNSPLIL